MTKVVKAKVSKPKKTQKTKGVMFPYEVWDVNGNGYFSPEGDFKTQKEAEKAIEGGGFKCPVIVFTDISSMLY